jgi:hypothetical protein
MNAESGGAAAGMEKNPRAPPRRREVKASRKRFKAFAPGSALA